MQEHNFSSFESLLDYVGFWMFVYLQLILLWEGIYNAHTFCLQREYDISRIATDLDPRPAVRRSFHEMREALVENLQMIMDFSALLSQGNNERLLGQRLFAHGENEYQRIELNSFRNPPVNFGVLADNLRQQQRLNAGYLHAIYFNNFARNQQARLEDENRNELPRIPVRVFSHGAALARFGLLPLPQVQLLEQGADHRENEEVNEPLDLSVQPVRPTFEEWLDQVDDHSDPKQDTSSSLRKR